MTRTCRDCKTELGGHVESRGTEEASPESGSISVCFYCGCISIFDRDLALVEPTEQEMEELKNDPVWEDIEFAQSVSKLGREALKGKV